MARNLNVAVEGCCHGELDLIYDTIREVERKGVKVDLLVVCGDFQCVRNSSDLLSLAVPHKYRQLKNFHEYVSGKKVAPVVTIFIGGNHEASNILQSLYYGGWVAPNIYYLGFGGVVWFGGVRIGGLSGIYNNRHYRLGHFENPPYTDDALRSVYHVREVEVYRMAHINTSIFPIDIFLSHDWPGGVVEYGDKARLLSKKQFLAEDIQSGKLGSPPLMDLMRVLKPTLWFAAHLHVKFAAIVPHTTPSSSSSSSSSSTFSTKENDQKKKQDGMFCQPVGVASTRFLALDKCLPGRDFLQVVSVPRQYQDTNTDPLTLSYDSEWLAVMRKTHNLLSTTRGVVSIPSVVQPLSPEEIVAAERMMRKANNGSLTIPPLLPNPIIPNNPGILTDPQTDFFLNALGLSHIWTQPCCETQSTIQSGQARQPTGFAFDNSYMDGVPEVGVFIDRNKTGKAEKSEKDPNSLSISDDEDEEAHHNSGADNSSNNNSSNNNGKITDVKRVKMMDANEINFDSDEDNNDWNTAAISASNLCKSAPNVGSSAPNPGTSSLGKTPLNFGVPKMGDSSQNRPQGLGVKMPFNMGKTDIISFDDDEDISGGVVSSIGMKLNLPPTRGLSLPPPKDV